MQRALFGLPILTILPSASASAVLMALRNSSGGAVTLFEGPAR
jgi:hypothetical protein